MADLKRFTITVTLGKTWTVDAVDEYDAETFAMENLPDDWSMDGLEIEEDKPDDHRPEYTGVTG